MAKRFPRTESDIATLAGRVVDGLTNAAEDFPAPPVSSEELRGKLDAFQAADTATVEATRGRRLTRVLQDPAAAGRRALGRRRHVDRHRAAYEPAAARGGAVLPRDRGQQGGRRAAERDRHSGVVAGPLMCAE